MVERKIKLKFDDKSENWNEWIHVTSKRLAKQGSVLEASGYEVLLNALFLFLFIGHCLCTLV